MAATVTLADARRVTAQNQSAAADPEASAWVSANAGTGKTHVLALRVLRLLLAATPPERILCLTYTKAAAAEMSERVFARLAEWVTAPPDQLEAMLAGLLGRAPDAGEVQLARTLFARTIETPGGLKVQTIHAFCERLLQRFPLEAGIAPGFRILDEEAKAELVGAAIDATLRVATGPRAGRLGIALGEVIRHTAADRFDGLLRNALGHRDILKRLIQQTESGDPFEDIERDLRAEFDVRPNVTTPAIEDELGAVLDDGALAEAGSALGAGSKTDVERAEFFAQARQALGREERIAALGAALLTKAGEPRKRLMTKALGEAHPAIVARLGDVQQRFHALAMERHGLAVVTASVALLRIADAVIGRYTDLKASRAALDFDDLIAHTASLLATSDDAQWVLYKLDNGLDHILVDEAQDTSPGQWQIIENIAREFFAGQGAREECRTIFAVGDEKQSIYSFQGARPQLFAAKGRDFGERSAGAGRTMRAIPLNLSFRSVGPVLAGVDGVFGDPSLLSGAGAPADIRHIANRAGEAGLIEVWPSEAAEDRAPGETWNPLGDEAPGLPAKRLADRIADQIGYWLASGEVLASRGTPIRAGDILILVRKRAPFAPVVIRALKARGIAVAGADRIRVTEQIAVMDLMALGDFLLLPEDDLALATVLKSALFDLDDDDLYALAHGRRGSLWQALLHAGDGDERLGPVADTLRRWRGRADYAPPFEFFSLILDREGHRHRLLTQLGPEAKDALDEFLSLALGYDETSAPSLQGFLHWLRNARPIIRRDMDKGRDEVRVMTVHGAKGLEAPIVFLPDTCSTRSRGSAGSLLEVPGDNDFLPPRLVWQIKGAGTHPRLAARISQVGISEREEYYRLLYVAMTRARDRLYVSGFEGARGRDRGCWYDLVRERLGDHLAPATGHDGHEVLRFAGPQEVAPVPGSVLAGAPAAGAPLPDWLARRARREIARTIPLAPSRIIPLDGEEAGRPATDQAVASPGALAGDDRLALGLATHLLLQHLPEVRPDEREGAGQALLASRAGGLAERARREIVTETLAILNDPAFSFLFAPDTLAEVPVVAEIPPPDGSGPALRITGSIDRLVITDSQITICDYKTNRPPPGDPGDVPDGYLAQLAAYRLALRRTFAGREFRTLLIWTYGPRIMEIPPRLLDDAERRLWMDPAALDG